VKHPYRALNLLQDPRVLGSVFGSVLLALLLIWLNGRPPSFDYIKRLDSPLTYQEAINEPDLKFPLPPTCRNVTYAAYADWQIGGTFVRFEAPVTDCLTHVDTVIAWYDRNSKVTSRFLRAQIGPDGNFPQEFKMKGVEITWFDVHRIKKGLHVAAGSQKPQMWVDLDLGVFYYQWNQ
jgi:hypothetical protein